VILFLAANPRDTGQLALDPEARAIHHELKRSGYRDRFDFQTRWAAEPLDLLREIRELKPTVVHVSGLAFHDAAGGTKLVSAEAVAQALAAVGAPAKLVVLNACFTEHAAQALLVHVDCVIGMGGSLHEAAARSFSVGFYGGLGELASVAAAFEQGKAAI